MIKTDNRHYNNTKSQKLLRLQTDMWIKLGSEQIDLTTIYPKKEIVEHNGEIIEVEYKSKCIDVDFADGSTLSDVRWKVQIKTDSGYVLENVLLPVPVCSDELYKEICELKGTIKNKSQNNIGNWDWKENENKMFAELEKIMRVKPIRTFVTCNMISKHKLENQYPLLWEKIK